MRLSARSSRSQAALARVTSLLEGDDDAALAAPSSAAVRSADTEVRVMSDPLASSSCTWLGLLSCSLLSSCNVRGDVQRPDFNAWSSTTSRK